MIILKNDHCGHLHLIQAVGHELMVDQEDQRGYQQCGMQRIPTLERLMTLHEVDEERGLLLGEGVSRSWPVWHDRWSSK